MYLNIVKYIFMYMWFNLTQAFCIWYMSSNFSFVFYLFLSLFIYFLKKSMLKIFNLKLNVNSFQLHTHTQTHTQNNKQTNKQTNPQTSKQTKTWWSLQQKRIGVFVSEQGVYLGMQTMSNFTKRCMSKYNAYQYSFLFLYWFSQQNSDSSSQGGKFI